MAARKSRAGATRRRRRARTRKPPRWIFKTKDLDLIAQRRCLMILSVLSGEKSVEDASREAQISSQQYYQFEKKALSAMLAALVPGASTDGSMAPAIKQMEKKLRELEIAKRRLERLLFLTRMTVKPGPMTHGKRGRPRMVQGSEDAGRAPSRRSTKSKKTSSPPQSTSTPMPDGAAVL